MQRGLKEEEEGGELHNVAEGRRGEKGEKEETKQLTGQRGDSENLPRRCCHGDGLEEDEGRWREKE